MARRAAVSALPLWKRDIPKYPVYWKGNPQLRIFLPQFWMKLIKGKDELPPDRVEFIVHPQMSELDVRNYLKKIYGVSVHNVNTELKQGADIIGLQGTVVGRHPDYKVALVQLADKTFTFPDIFEGKILPQDNLREETEKVKKEEKENVKKYYNKLSVPPWFRH